MLPREARIARDLRFISVSSEFGTKLLSVFFLNVLLGLTFLYRFYINSKKDSAILKMLKIIFNVIKHNP